ncbi:uncharacterized protein TRAVEDRAFT_151424 [Trametes versicolor FP-101664 SS1]|uniref:uncharacterized protein n=1 Tax=Trametes versicolor (strain FP-101664) TaxID=717944 RepID=UPI0004624518|nr:uncharacterized protein TRAVEDRAFT_151424 [Trametes versicolor FP-101664 SS1]EIW56796.1 hypothetical protein TRAVEDRAFT_151424 [Trametes versicolor FP-101664 SS1]
MSTSGVSTGAGDSETARYVVQSSDVLEDMRVNVQAEGSERVVWYKERFLSDDEIIEHIVDNETSTLLWTIHRPKRGWYIRVRAPSFPPGVFISLTPIPQTSPYHAEAALSFACRTNLPATPTSPPSRTRPSIITNFSTDSDATLTNGSRDSMHSYPPTPPQGPSIVVNPPSPRSVHAKLDSVSLSPTLRPQRRPAPPTVQSAVTHFVLTPHSRAHIPEQVQQVSIFTRLMSVIKNNAPSHSYSFTLSPIPSAPLPAPTPAPPTSPTSEVEPRLIAGAEAGAGTSDGNPLTPVPLLTFHDRTPVWTAHCNSGLIELDERQVRVLGVEPAFYIALALTYLEFLQERESYLVAAYD